MERPLTIGRFVVAGGVGVERPNTVGGVQRARVKKERRVAGSRVLGAGLVEQERERPVGRVPVAVCIGLERRKTVGRIGVAVRQTEEGILTLGGVFVGIPPIWRRVNAESFRSKTHKAGE